jgi:hypothetical protein
MYGVSFIFLFIGFFFGNKSKHNSSKFFVYLLFGLIFSTPWMIGGHVWYDEFFLFGYILGSFKIKKKINFSFPEVIFIFLIFYLLIQSIRGIFFIIEIEPETSIQKLRWVIFFLAIFIIFLITKSQPKSYIPETFLKKYLFKSILYFNFIYFGVGIIYLILFGSQFESQYAGSYYGILAATAYVAPLFYIFTSLNFLLFAKNSNYRFYNLKFNISFGIIILINIFYLSRSVMFGIIFFSFFFFFSKERYKFLSNLIFSFPIIIIFFLSFGLNNENLYNLYFEINELIVTNFGPASTQVLDRKILNYASFLAIQESPMLFLFGGGLKSSGYIAAPFVHDLLITNGFASILKKDVSLTGFSSLLLDLGVIGILLIIFLIFLAFLQIRKNNYPLYCSLLPLVFFLHLFVTNITEMLLLYFMIMPTFINGLFPKKNY